MRLLPELHFASKNQSVLVVLLGVGQVPLVGRVALGGEDGRLGVADDGAPAQVRGGGDGLGEVAEAVVAAEVVEAVVVPVEEVGVVGVGVVLVAVVVDVGVVGLGGQVVELLGLVGVLLGLVVVVLLGGVVGLHVV